MHFLSEATGVHRVSRDPQTKICDGLAQGEGTPCTVSSLRTCAMTAAAQGRCRTCCRALLLNYWSPLHPQGCWTSLEANSLFRLPWKSARGRRAPTPACTWSPQAAACIALTACTRPAACQSTRGCANCQARQRRRGYMRTAPGLPPPTSSATRATLAEHSVLAVWLLPRGVRCCGSGAIPALRS